MSDTLKIWLGLPPRELSPNARVHWAAKARAVKAYRQEAYLEAKLRMVVAYAKENGARDFPWPGARLRAEFHFLTKRKRDTHNFAASLKPALDGFADAGIVKDDTTIYIVGVRIVAGAPKPGVEIELARSEA